MQVELRDLMLSDPAISSIVGGRIDWGVSPQGSAMPRVVMQIIGNNGQVFLFSGGSGFYTARVQINCYGETYGAAAGLAGAVKDLLDVYQAGIFLGVFCVSERDEYAGGVTDAPRIFGKQLDFIINWSK